MQRRAVIRGPTKKTENRFAFDSDSEDDEETTVDYTRLSVGKPVVLQGAWQSKSTVQDAAPAAAAKTSPSDKILQRIKEVEAQLAEVQEELCADVAPISSTGKMSWADMCDEDDDEKLKLKETVLKEQLERLRRKF